MDNLNPVELNIDEFEALRLRDYLDVQQKSPLNPWGYLNQPFTEL